MEVSWPVNELFSKVVINLNVLVCNDFALVTSMKSQLFAM